jgi:hypothetical protein
MERPEAEARMKQELRCLEMPGPWTFARAATGGDPDGRQARNRNQQERSTT